jgi:inosine/guanosine/xanthosine phosphorylase family protein
MKEPQMTVPATPSTMSLPDEPLHARRVALSVSFLEEWNQGHPVPQIAVILGSGLSNAVPGLDDLRCLKWNEVHGFSATHVQGHRSELRIGKVEANLPDGSTAAREVAFLRGRNHAYEGFDAGQVVHNVRTLVRWGVKGIVLTNAAGCLNIERPVGSLMLVSDHINFTGLNPLASPYGDGFMPRFVDMSRCYDGGWRAHIRSLAAQQGVLLSEGVYFGVLGPTYETPAEIRMMQMLGANAVGMSTVLESIAAHQLGAKVAALSCFTNHGAGLLPEEVLDHAGVLNVGIQSSAAMANLLLASVVSLPTGPSI